MIELHMTNSEIIQKKGIAFQDIEKLMSRTPVFLKLPGMLIRAEDISVIQEVDDDD